MGSIKRNPLELGHKRLAAYIHTYYFVLPCSRFYLDKTLSGNVKKKDPVFNRKFMKVIKIVPLTPHFIGTGLEDDRVLKMID